MTGWDTAFWRDLDAAVTRLQEQIRRKRDRKEREAIRSNKQISDRYFGPQAKYVTRQRKTRGGL